MKTSSYIMGSASVYKGNCSVFSFNLRFLLDIWILATTSLLVAGLRDVRVTIPDAVRSGDCAELLCHFDLEGDILYSVKWYKGRREFYRFTPKETPPTKVFPIPGLSIKIRKSNSTHLVLDQVVPVLSGRYSCEVSADAPSFHTALVSGDMDVVVTPKHRPLLQGMKHRYRVGDIMKVNCTSSGSRPAANLTWFFNGEQVHPRHVKLYRTVTEPEDRLESSTSTLEIPLKPHHFTAHGRIKVRCIASLYSLYWQTTEKSAEEERPKSISTQNDVITSRVNHEMADQDYTSGVQELQVEAENNYFVKAAPSAPHLNAGDTAATTNIILLATCLWTVLEVTI